jgi:hypothetical protein
MRAPAPGRCPDTICSDSRYPDAAFQVFAIGLGHGLAPNYELLVANAQFAPLRLDPRFPGIAAKSRAQLDDVCSALNAARARGELPKCLEAPLDELVKQVGR